VKPDAEPKLTEAALAASIARHFEDLQWDVYQEVQLQQGASRADLVVKQGALVGVVEVKQALGLPVLEQAFGWQGYAHFVWVATWHRSGHRLAHRILEDYGIGHISVYSHKGSIGDDAREKVQPRLCATCRNGSPRVRCPGCASTGATASCVWCWIPQRS